MLKDLTWMVNKLGPEFGVIDEELGAMHPVEQDITGQLERSAKLDEVDTVTFGLETDDNKIVKVYVKAEQADDFEKALAEKLGEIDDIEECLNALSKDFEIVDVEWPAEETEEDKEETADDGSDALNPKVYNNSHEKASQEQTLKPNMEHLNFGERASLSLLEDAAGSIEGRMVTALQLMVYHGILELGVPELALNKSPYRSAIIKGIKEKALELSRNAAIKNSLKGFITRSINFDVQAHKNHEDRMKDHGDLKGKNIEQELRQELHHRYSKEEKPADKKPAEKKSVKEAFDMNADTEHEDDTAKYEPDPPKQAATGNAVAKLEWKFDKDRDENLTIACSGLKVTLNSEEIEKMVKGVTNKDAVVVRDEEDPTHKVVFSPRGPNVLVKKVGSPDGLLMAAKDVDELLSFIGKPEEAPPEAGGDVEATGNPGTQS